MTGVMKNRKNNVLQFPEPSNELGGSTITCEAGGQRFRIHMQVEDLPPLPPPEVKRKRAAKNAPSKVVRIDAKK